jgi:serine/threonine protein kinase
LQIDDFKKVVLKKLGKKYKYIRDLGGGTFSNVYLVLHTIFNEEHALKIMNSQHILKKLEKENIDESKQRFDKIKERFIKEAKLYKRINHPNVVKIHDIDVIMEEKRSIEFPYLIMDYIKGSSLTDIIENEAPLEFNRVLGLAKDILGAIEVIHKNNIIHRDLKPDNIMVAETGKAILIDFGLAKDLLSDTKLTSTGISIGTPLYMSPEQCLDSSKVGKYTDIYSFGVVLFEMLAGEPPFGGNNFFEIMNAHCEKPVPDVRGKNPGLPAGIEKIIQKAMAKEASDRYKNAEIIINELNAMG